MQTPETENRNQFKDRCIQRNDVGKGDQGKRAVSTNRSVDSLDRISFLDLTSGSVRSVSRLYLILSHSLFFFTLLLRNLNYIFILLISHRLIFKTII